MALRHGKDALRVETLQADEQPEGIPAPSGGAGLLQAEPARRSNGQLADRQGASQLGRRGGLARAAKASQLAALIGLGLRGAAPEVLGPFLADANAFAASEVERLARECGGGVCPQNAAALVQQAALAMAGSRAAYAQGDTALGAKLGVEVRQNLLGARELCVREAQSRPRAQSWPQVATVRHEGEDDPPEVKQ